MIKLIIFDYDGVIVDSFPKIYEVYKILLKKLNKKCPDSLEEFKKLYGDSHIDLNNKLNLTEEEATLSNVIFKEEIIKQEIELFEGIIEVLKQLNKKYKIILITSNYKDEAICKLKRFGIEKYFIKIIGKNDHKVMIFDKCESIKYELKFFNIKEDEAILIGDRNVDFFEGHKAGLKHILLVDYGWGYDKSKIPLWEQKFIVKKPIDLINAVNSLNDD